MRFALLLTLWIFGDILAIFTSWGSYKVSGFMAGLLLFGLTVALVQDVKEIMKD